MDGVEPAPPLSWSNVWPVKALQPGCSDSNSPDAGVFQTIATVASMSERNRSSPWRRASSARRRPPSILLSKAAFHQIKAVKMTMLVSTNSESAITRSSIPSCRPSQTNHPTSAGIKITAGSSRRAITPPASPLVMTTITPRSGRAARMPLLMTARARAVFSAIGMNRSIPASESEL